MNDTPRPTSSFVPQAELDADRARIGDELVGLDRGLDPFVAAVRATRMPMVVTDPRQPDNPIVFANDAFCRLTGYPRAEILGRNCRFLQCEETDKATVARIREAVEAQRSIEVEIRNSRKTGDRFWNRLLLAPVRDAAGELAYFFASQVDVTSERERLLGLEHQNAALLAELGSRLRKQESSEARLRFATQAGRLGIWELDLKTGEMITSALCRQNFGRDPAVPFTYDELRASVHPDDSERMSAAVSRIIESGGSYDIEYRVNRPDGSVGWVEVRALVQRDVDGTPLSMAGTSLDISDRKRGEARTEALLLLDERLRTLETPGDNAYAAAEILGRLLGVSRAGYGTIDTREETISIERDWNAPGISSLAGVLRFRDYGSYIDDLKRGDLVVFADAERDSRTAPTADALKAISAQAVVNMPVMEHGGLVALLYLTHATAREWPPEDLAFIRQIAERTRMAVERRRAEQDVRALANTLEAQVAARTAQLMETEAALRQSQKMEAVGQLTGGLAHDFNNLLTGIMGSLELLQARVAQGRLTDLDRYASAAQGAAKRAAALTHRLLAFSRRQTLDPKATGVNRLVSGMEDLIRRTVGPEIVVESVLSAGLWTTMVDGSQLENALLNLCINARDAMPNGGTLTIETANRWIDDRTARERQMPHGQFVSLCVSDNGIGMTPDVIAKAFDPFFTTKPIGLGTGLGLSMIYGFAKQSGGQARIYSEVGQGTLVCLYLPRYGGEVDSVQESDFQVEIRRPGHQETVLIIDDEPTVRMLVTDVLEDLGYTILEAVDGASGLRLLQSSERVDLLITDVGLPGGMNGRQVADAARLIRPDLQILFITGYAENALLSHGHLDPGMHVLTKPFEIDALAKRVEDLVAARKETAPSQATPPIR